MESEQLEGFTDTVETYKTQLEYIGTAVNQLLTIPTIFKDVNVNNHLTGILMTCFKLYINSEELEGYVKTDPTKIIYAPERLHYEGYAATYCRRKYINFKMLINAIEELISEVRTVKNFPAININLSSKYEINEDIQGATIILINSGIILESCLEKLIDYNTKLRG